MLIALMDSLVCLPSALPMWPIPSGLRQTYPDEYMPFELSEPKPRSQWPPLCYAFCRHTIVVSRLEIFLHVMAHVDIPLLITTVARLILHVFVVDSCSYQLVGHVCRR